MNFLVRTEAMTAGKILHIISVLKRHHWSVNSTLTTEITNARKGFSKFTECMGIFPGEKLSDDNAGD